MLLIPLRLTGARLRDKRITYSRQDYVRKWIEGAIIGLTAGNKRNAINHSVWANKR